MAKVAFTTPVGRMVQGSVSKAQTTDGDGKPLLVKNGPNAGKPTQKYYIAIAIPKNPGETHWAQTEWGKIIWAAGHAAFPQVAQSPAFAWKVADGDSTIPNQRGVKPCDQEGFRGCWILRCSSSFAPKCYNKDGSAAIPPESIKAGYFVQAYADVDGNQSNQKPGVFINAAMVALAGYGEEIVQGPDPTAAGFGAAPLPPGATAVPPAGFQPPPATPGAPPAAYVPPVAPPAAYVPPVAPPAAYVPPVAPNPAFTLVPPVAPPPAAPAHAMTAKAGATTYEAFIAAGWNDTTLRQNGYMI